MSKRKSDAIEPILTTCLHCSPFCASWTSCTLTEGLVKYIGGSHAHRIYDRYHQHHLSESDDSDDDDEAGRFRVRRSVKPEPVEIAPPKFGHGLSVEQRVAFLSCLYKLSKTSSSSHDFRLFSDSEFLQDNFQDLIHDQDDNKIRFVLLYSCNKVEPECHALPRGHGVAELEKRVGKLQVYKDPYRSENEDDDDSDDDQSDGDGDDGSNNLDNDWEYGDCPHEVAWLPGNHDGGRHFTLTKEQWNKLRADEGCIECPLTMSVFTYQTKDPVNVRSILNAMEII